MNKWHSEWVGNETDRSGDALFKVGKSERIVHFNEFSDYHAVAQLLNEARQMGKDEGEKGLMWKVQRAMGVSE